MIDTLPPNESPDTVEPSLRDGGRGFYVRLHCGDAEGSVETKPGLIADAQAFGGDHDA
jgi:hypothetical protein